jgi:hypothetical protein
MVNLALTRASGATDFAFSYPTMQRIGIPRPAMRVDPMVALRYE